MTVRTALFHSAALPAVLWLAGPAHAQDGTVATGTGSPTRSAPAANPQSPIDSSTTPTATPPGSGVGNDAPDIVVTASRAGRSGYDAPTPTKVLSAAAIEQRASTNVGEFLNEIPSFRPSQTAQTNTQANANAGQTFADLRGLGSVRTLTLVDGRRHVPSAATGQVDLNLIPTILVERVEVVTGGASAQWGSDAVSGVVNVLLNKRLKGLKADFSLGLAGEGDDFERRGALAYGTVFAQDRGHFVIGGEYVKSDGIDSFLDRSWGRRSEELASYPAAGVRAANQPSRGYYEGVGVINFTKGGLILGNNADTNAANGADVLRGIQFGPGGTVLPFNYGQTIGTTNSINFSASSPYGTAAPLSIRDGHTATLPVERYAALGHVDYNLTDNISAMGEFSYGRSGAKFHTPPVRDSSTTALIIRRDNAFLPAPIAAIIDNYNATLASTSTARITSFPLGRQFDDFGQVRADNSTTAYRGVAGLNGSFAETFKWNVYYEYGHSRFQQHTDNLRVESRFLLAADAILVGGVPVCRDVAARAAGCVALNPFGVGSPSQAAINYVTGQLRYDVVNREDVAAANLSGEPFSTWAGPVSVAVGGEYRREKSVGTVDAISQASGFNYGNPKAFAGSFNVREGYLETVIPLAKDVTLLKSLDFNGAVRFTHYSTSGSVTTWKLGGTWEPLAGLRIRATRSRDIRAPNNSELFAVTSTKLGIINTFPGAGNGSNNQYNVITAASPSLKPEKADTTTVGAVLAPKFLPGFQASVDYFDIKVKGAISTVAVQTIVDNCAVANIAFYCGFVDRTTTSAGTQINSVTQALINLASIKTRGIDFETSYRFNMLGGRLTTRVFGTYTKDLIVNDGLNVPVTFNSAGILTNRGSVINYAGTVGTAGTGFSNQPHWTVNGALTYENDVFSTTIQGRYVGGGKVNPTLLDSSDPLYNPLSPISVENNDVKSRFYLNLSGSVKVYSEGTRKVEFYGVVNNLFDVSVPFPAAQLNGLYDRIGRFFRVGIRASY